MSVSSISLAEPPAFAQPAGTVIRVDIKRGRLVVPQGRAGQTIKVSYHSGFSADMGGGTYDRRKWILRPTADVTVSGGGGALDAAIAGRVPVMVSPGRIANLRSSTSMPLTVTSAEAHRDDPLICGTAPGVPPPDT